MRRGREHRTRRRKVKGKKGLEIKVRLFTFDSLGSNGVRTRGGRPGPSPEFRSIYKIPIEFAMFEIINCNTLEKGSIRGLGKNEDLALGKQRHARKRLQDGSESEL
jgi:hypothetical protein